MSKSQTLTFKFGPQRDSRASYGSRGERGSGGAGMVATEVQTGGISETVEREESDARSCQCDRGGRGCLGQVLLEERGAYGHQPRGVDSPTVKEEGHPLKC